MPNIPALNARVAYVTNLNLAWASTSTLTVASGACSNSDNTNDILISDAITINAATNGLNGLDTGALANTTWYYVYAIGSSTNSQPSGCILSTSSSAPTLPFEYDIYRRIGEVRTNGSAQFLLFYQIGNNGERIYYWDAIVSSGVSVGSATFAAASLSSAVPVTSRLAIIQARIVPNAAGNALSFRRTGSSENSSNINIAGPVASQPVSGQFQLPCNASQSIDYKTTSASDTPTISVAGFCVSL